MDSFIVRMWLWVLEKLKYVSPSHWVCSMYPPLRASYGFVDAWVLGNTALCLVLLIFLKGTGTANSIWHVIVYVYGGLRLLEIVVVNATILFFQAAPSADPAKAYALRGYRRIVVLALHNYAEIILWFAIFYTVLSDHFSAANCVLATEHSCAIYFSLVTMATVGYGDVFPKDYIGHLLVSAHISVAIFLTVIILARVVAYLPRPPSLDPHENRKDA